MTEANAPGSNRESAAADSPTRLQVGLRLQPVNHSEQPIFSNFTLVQGAPGVVFLDFGFLEPTALPAIARLAKSGGKMPDSIDGRLACRVVLGTDVAAQLAQQLTQHLKSAAPSPQAAAKTGKATN